MAETITVEVPDRIADTMRRAVDDGVYPSPGDLVRQLLEDWVSRNEADAIAELRRLWEEGLNSGPSRDADEVFARVRGLLSGR